MSTKTTTAQPPGRRTPLSLNTGPKQNNKPSNDSGKRETNFTNTKTDNPKKDSQPEKRLTSDKKQPSTETRKPASSDTKKPEEVKATKLEENKKNQNGVSTNGTNSSTNGTNGTNAVKEKDKQNGNEGAAVKPKQGGASSGSETPKKESQKSNEKKKETVSEVAPKEAQKQEIKNKVDEKNKEKQKPIEEDNKKLVEKKEDEKKDTKGDAEKIKLDEKVAVKADNTKEGERSNKEVETINLDSSSEEKAAIAKSLPVKAHKNEEITTPKSPIKENERQSKKEHKQKPIQLDDVEMMEPLAFESEPPSSQISAASTPAKNLTFTRIDASPKSEVKLPRVPTTYSPDRKSCPRTFSSISGRRSIRPMGDYTFTGHLNIRESYRKINTELDFTTSSMNVTVGSEVPNNDSFSFFSRSRKRDRSSPSRPSNMEVQGDISPKSPKRARVDFGMAGFFNAMASPITMLRARLSRATVQSTPKKIDVELPIEEDVVENVSGISIEEDITPTEKLMVDPDSTVGNIGIDDDDNPKGDDHAEFSDKPAVDELKYEDELKVKETMRTTESQAKKKCSIM